MTGLIVLGSGLCFFLAVYLPFAAWEEVLWKGAIIKNRDNLKKEYEDLFRMKSDAEVLKEILMWGGGIAFVLFIISPSKILGLILAIIFFFIGSRIPLYMARNFARAKRIDRFSTQMVDALTLMANGMRSGLNVPQALQVVVDEMPAPVSQEFGLVLDQNRIGVPLEAAFESMANRLKTEEMYIFSTSVNILRETGGNMAETFDTITKTIRERIKLQKKIKALTAQGRTAGAIVGCIPFGILIMMFFIDPEFVMPLVTTVYGFLILGVVCILDVLGLYVINKMVQIKV